MNVYAHISRTKLLIIVLTLLLGVIAAVIQDAKDYEADVNEDVGVLCSEMH